MASKSEYIGRWFKAGVTSMGIIVFSEAEVYYCARSITLKRESFSERLPLKPDVLKGRGWASTRAEAAQLAITKKKEEAERLQKRAADLVSEADILNAYLDGEPCKVAL